MKVSKFLNIYLILYMCLGFQSLSIAEEQSDLITIVSSWKNAPFSFYLPDGTPAGMYVDFWRMWSEVNDIPIKIVLTSFDDSIDLVKEKNTIHAGLFINKEREQWAGFSIPFYQVNTGVMVGPMYSNSILLEDIDACRVAVQRKTYQAGYLEENRPNIELVYVDSADAGIDKLLSGDVDAIVAEIPPLESQLQRRGLMGVFSITGEIIASNKVHGVVAKGQPELLRKVSEGISNMPIGRVIENELRWLPGLKPFFEDLNSLDSLTLAEKNWLHDNKNFSLGVETNLFPFEYVDENGKFMGVTADYVASAEASLGIKLNITGGYSWSESLERLVKGELDVMSGVVKNPERAKLMRFTEPYFAIPGVIVIRQNTFYVESLTDLKQKKAGIVRGYVLVDSVRQDFPDIEIVEVDSVADGLLRLQKGELDAYIGAIAVVNYEISRRQLTGLMIAASTPYKFEISMAVRKGLEPLVKVLNKNFASMSSAQKSAIANRWLAIDVKVGLDQGVILLWSIPILSFLMLIIFIFARINKRLNFEISNREASQEQQKLLEARLYQSQKMEALGKLTGGIAHDFNNMLGIINGYSELLSIGVAEPSKQQEYAEEILRAGNRGAKLTSKLLAYSRQQVLESTSVDINELLIQQQDMLQKLLTVRINLVLNLQENLSRCWLDSNEFVDVVINICINAMHALTDNQVAPQLSILTRNTHVSDEQALQLGVESGSYVLLTVSDNGCGMDKQTLSQVFDPFFTTKGHAGSGLGLSQAYGFIQRSNGSIIAESVLGRGTNFLLYFPIHEVFESEQEKERKNDECLYHETILVVDDESGLRKLATEFLIRKGYATFEASSGQDALDLLAREQVDLVFTDVIMPGMDGYELAEIIKKKYPRIKIQLVSGFVDEERKRVVDGDEERPIIHKPYTSQVLYIALRKLLD